MAYYSIENNKFINTDASFTERGGNLGCEVVYLTEAEAEVELPEQPIGMSLKPGDMILDRTKNTVFFITEEDAE